jgi:hypothetical protein
MEDPPKVLIEEDGIHNFPERLFTCAGFRILRIPTM